MQYGVAVSAAEQLQLGRFMGSFVGKSAAKSFKEYVFNNFKGGVKKAIKESALETGVELSQNTYDLATKIFAAEAFGAGFNTDQLLDNYIQDFKSAALITPLITTFIFGVGAPFRFSGTLSNVGANYGTVAKAIVGIKPSEVVENNVETVETMRAAGEYEALVKNKYGATEQGRDFLFKYLNAKDSVEKNSILQERFPDSKERSEAKLLLENFKRLDNDALKSILSVKLEAAQKREAEAQSILKGDTTDISALDAETTDEAGNISYEILDSAIDALGMRDEVIFVNNTQELAQASGMTLNAAEDVISRKGAKGFFDEKNGKIVIIKSHFASGADALQSFAHEYGHKIMANIRKNDINGYKRMCLDVLELIGGEGVARASLPASYSQVGHANYAKDSLDVAEESLMRILEQVALKKVLDTRKKSVWARFKGWFQKLFSEKSLADITNERLAQIALDVLQKEKSFNVSVPNTPSKNWRAKTPEADGVSVSGEWEVVDAGDLKTSLDAGYDDALQPRNRSRQSSKEQVLNIANNLDPELLDNDPRTSDGAPIVDSRSMAVSGNGRILAIRQAYESGKAEEYRKHVLSRANSMGIDVPAGIKNPVLIRRVKDTGNMSIEELAARSNKSSVAGMSVAEQAVADGRRISETGLLDIFFPGADGNILAESNRDFNNAFLNLVGGSETFRNKDGSLRTNLSPRVRAAVLAAMLNSGGNRDIVERLLDNPEGYNALINGLMQCAANLAELSQKPQYDISGELSQAVELYIEMHDKGQTVAEFEAQPDMFREQPSAEVMFLCRLFEANQKSSSGISGVLKEYAAQCKKIDTTTADLFGEEDPSKLDKLQAAYDHYATDLAQGMDNLRALDRGNPAYANFDERKLNDKETLKNLTPEEILERIKSVKSVSFPVERLDENFNLKYYWNWFEKNLLDREIPTAIRRNAVFKKGHFFKLIAGGKNKGFIKGYTTPEDAFKAIKKGKVLLHDKDLAPEGFSMARARQMPLVLDVLQDPFFVLKDKKTKDFIFLKKYEGGDDWMAVMFNDTDMGIISWHQKNITRAFAEKNTIVKQKNGVDFLAQPRESSKRDESLKTLSESENNSENQENSSKKWREVSEPSPEEIADARRQYEEVKSKYRGTPLWMKAPNGKPTNLTEEQWVRVRTPNFKRWFGDWEKEAWAKAAMDFLERTAPVANLTGQEFQKDGVKLTDKVPAYFKSIGNVARNDELGDVVLDLKGVEDSIAHGVGRLKSAAFMAVPDVIEKGFIFNREENWKERGWNTAVIVAPIKLGEDDYVCEVVVKKVRGQQRFYLHEVEIKKTLDGVFKSVANNGNASQVSKLILGKHLAEVKGNVSKVVDENGEPMVVYHGTPKFDRFSIFKKGSGGYLGPAIYFTNLKTYAQKYENKWGEGGNLYDVFLSLRNPLVVKSINPAKEILKTIYGKDSIYDKRSQKQSYDTKILSSADIKKLQSKGYDGVVWEYGGSKEYAVYDSSKIKSATDNIGTYSENPDIRWRLDEGAAELDARHAGLYERYKGGDEAAYGEALELVADEARRKGYDVKVYHGTGANGFNVALADSSKSENGEGAQAHGAGLYMAASRDIADGYMQRAGGGYFTRYKLNGRDLYNTTLSPSARVALISAKKRNANIEELIEGNMDNPYRLATYRQVKAFLDAEHATVDDVKIIEEKTGNVFDWFHNMKPDELFDEGKYLSEQPEVFEKYKEAWDEDIAPIIDERIAEYMEKNIGVYYEESFARAAERRKEEVSPYSDNEKTRYAFDSLAEYLGADRFREIMLKHGIRGITYDGRQDGRVFVSFEGGATVKLQDPFTFDDEGKLIPLSRRFDRFNPDMRWKIDDPSPERVEKLRAARPVEIGENDYKGLYELNAKSAREYVLKKLRGRKYVNADTGDEIEIGQVGTRKITTHDRYNKDYLRTFAAIPQMIENAVYLGEEPNEKGNSKYDKYRYYACGLKIGGRDYTARLTIGERNGKWYYDQALTEMEKGDLIEQVPTQASVLSARGSPYGFIDNRLISLLQENNSENSSRLRFLLRQERSENPDIRWREVSEPIKQKFSSGNTSLRQIAAGFKKIDFKPGSTNFDLGGGKFDEGTKYLETKGVKNFVFDPVNRDSKTNKEAFEIVKNGGFDTTTCNNVLNVISEANVRDNIILQAAKSLRPNGTAYFTVYEGDGSGKGRQSQKDSWQEHRKTVDYLGEIKKHFGDVSLKNKVITARKPILLNEKASWFMDDSFENPVRWKDDADISDISAKVKKIIDSISDKKNKHIEVLRKISDTEADFLLKKTGLDLKGYSHSIDNYSILHILKKHGSEKELQRGQIPVTIKDIQNFPTIVSDYDDVKYAGKSKIGRDTIRFEKNIGDNLVLVFEEMRIGKKLLALSTMYIQKRKKLTSNANASSNTSETLSTSSDFQESANTPENQENNSRLKALLRQERSENPVIWASIVLAREILLGRAITNAKIDKVLPPDKFDGTKRQYAVNRAREIAERYRADKEKFGNDLNLGVQRAENDLYWTRDVVEEMYASFRRDGEEYGIARQRLMEWLKERRRRDLETVKGLSSEELGIDVPAAIEDALEKEPERRKPGESAAEESGEETFEASGEGIDAEIESAREKPAPSSIRDIIGKIRAGVTKAAKARGMDEAARRRAYRNTLAEVLRESAKRLTYGREREAIMKKIAELSQKGYAVIKIKEGERAGQKIDNYTLRAEHIALRIFNRGVRDTKRELSEKFEKIVSRKGKKPSRMERDDKRALAGAVQMRVYNIKRYSEMDAAELEAEYSATVDKLENVEKNFAEDAGKGEVRSDIEDIRAEVANAVHDMKMFGNWRDKSRAQMAEGVEFLEKYIDEETEEQKARVEARKEENARRRNVFIAALRQSKRNANKDGELRKLFRGIVNNTLPFDSILSILGEAATGKTYAEFKSLSNEIVSKVNRAAENVSNECFAKKEKLYAILRECYGEDQSTALRRLLKADAKYERFSKNPETPNPMTLANVMQLYATALQKNYERNIFEHRARKSEKEVTEYNKIQDIIESINLNSTDEYSKGMLKQSRESLERKREAIVARSVSKYISELEGVLTEADKNFVAALRAEYAEALPALSAVSRRVIGLPIEQADELYMPVKVDYGGGLGEGTGGVPVVPKSLSPRVSHLRDFDETADPITLYLERVKENAQFKYFSELYIELRGIFADESLQKLIRERCGADVLKLLKESIADICTGETKGFNLKAARQASGLFAIAQLGWNFGSGVRQFLPGIFSWGAYIGTPAVLRNCASFFTPEGFRAALEIAHSETGRRRFAVGNMQIIEEMLEKPDQNRFWRLYKRYALIFNRSSDMLAIMFVGQGVYRSGVESYLKKGFSEAEAKRLAMSDMWQIAERSQASGKIQNMSAWQRRGGDLAKAIGMFSSPPQLMFAKATQDMRRAIALGIKTPEGRAAAWNAAKTLFTVSVLVEGSYAASTVLWNALLKGYFDDDDDEYILKNMLTGPFGGLFLFGRLVDSLGTGYSPSAIPMEGLARPAQYTIELVKDIAVFDWDEALKDLDKLASSAFSPWRDLRKILKDKKK